MRFTSNNIGFYTMEDMQDICGKCQSASYDGDWSIQDCDYCILPKVMFRMKVIADKLDATLGATTNREGEEVIYNEFISE